MGMKNRTRGRNKTRHTATFEWNCNGARSRSVPLYRLIQSLCCGSNFLPHAESERLSQLKLVAAATCARQKERALGQWQCSQDHRTAPRIMRQDLWGHGQCNPSPLRLQAQTSNIVWHIVRCCIACVTLFVVCWQCAYSLFRVTPMLPYDIVQFELFYRTILSDADTVVRHVHCTSHI